MNAKTLFKLLLHPRTSLNVWSELLISIIFAFSEPDLEKIMDAFDDSDTEVVVEELPSNLKHLNLSDLSKFVK